VFGLDRHATKSPRRLRVDRVGWGLAHKRDDADRLLLKVTVADPPDDEVMGIGRLVGVELGEPTLAVVGAQGRGTQGAHDRRLDLQDVEVLKH
jgi:hypothetical protein